MPDDALSHLHFVLQKAGAEALAFFDVMTARNVTSKAPGDLVSDADRAVEVTLRRLLDAAFPGVAVLGEEYGGETGDKFWAVDPIDGTSNFLSGLPFWTISLGLMDQGQPVLGGIIAPALGLMGVGGPSRGLQITGLSHGSRPESPPCIGIGRNPRWPATDRQATEDAIEAADMSPRLFGSCALSLMLVAAGRLAGYVEPRVGGLWDCVGGLALCQAAGLATRFRLHSDGSVDVATGAGVTLPTSDW